MIKTFKYKNGEVKVIWNEEPMVRNYKYDCSYQVIDKATYRISNSFLVGIELKINRGGRIIYGLLAAKVYPHDEKNLVKISVEFTKENTIRYEKSNLYNDKFVYKGLPKEFVEQVEKSIFETILKKESYPQCDIEFKYAANCEVGSSSMIFGIIAELIVNLINTTTEDKVLNMDIENFTKKYMYKLNMIY